MACSECKKLSKEQQEYYDKSERMTKIAVAVIFVVGALAIYGLVTLIDKFI